MRFYTSERKRGKDYDAIDVSQLHCQLVSDKVVVIQSVYSSPSRSVRTSGSLREIIEEDWRGHGVDSEEIMGSSV